MTMMGSNKYHRKPGNIANVICESTIPGQAVSEYIPCELRRLFISNETKSINLLE